MTIFTKERIEEHFAAAEQEFIKRWQTFARNRKFTTYFQQFTDEEILNEFNSINATRNEVYYKNPEQQSLTSGQDFERSSELLTGGFYKDLHIIAFNYNFSHSSYNSSNIILNGYRFLALEGPQKPEHVSHFKHLLINYGVKTIVRLTDDFEDKVFKSQNYWRGNLKQSSDRKQLLTFTLPENNNQQSYSFAYYAIDNWADHQGIDPKQLLDLINLPHKTSGVKCFFFLPNFKH